MEVPEPESRAPKFQKFVEAMWNEAQETARIGEDWLHPDDLGVEATKESAGIATKAIRTAAHCFHAWRRLQPGVSRPRVTLTAVGGFRVVWTESLYGPSLWAWGGRREFSVLLDELPEFLSWLADADPMGDTCSVSGYEDFPMDSSEVSALKSTAKRITSLARDWCERAGLDVPPGLEEATATEAGL